MTMTIEEFMTTLQSAPHGGSARGISFWSKAATCGRKAVLDEQIKEEEADTHTDEEDVGPMAVGTHYHRLHELAIRGQRFDEVWDMRDSAMSAAMLEAIRLFRGYQRDWGSVGQRFGGTAVGTEVGIPATEAGAQAIREEFGDDLTGRIDAIVDVTDPEAAFQGCGLALEPGRYLVDFKSLKSNSAQHEWNYRFSLQAATYLHIYNLENPENPAKGMIFDIIFKHANLRKVADKKGGASYMAYLQLPNSEDPKVIQSLVQLGKRNIENEGATNPASCFSGFSPCKHFVSGRCGRF
jgi:hypothetical protein